MKTCPYCAEEIKDAAIRCRWCLSWLVDEIPAGAEGPPPKTAIVPKEEPEAEAVPEGEPKAEEPAVAPAQAAMVASEVRPEPEPTPVAEQTPAAEPTTAAAPEPISAQAAPAATPGEAKIEFTHTGSRYLLGYAPDHFGIWDRNAPQQPIERFPRNDEGWTQAWTRYSQMERNWMDLRTGQKSG